MKRNIIFSLIMLMTLAASCRVNEPLPSDAAKKQDKGSMTITATLEMPSTETRTQLSEGTKVVWKSGDQIKVFNESNKSGATFTLAASCDGSSTGTFTGYISGSGPYYAIYPASASKGFSGTEISLALPDTQTYAEDSFASGANIAVCCSTDLSQFAFKNLCGVLCLRLTGDKSLKKIVVTSKTGEYLNGSAKVDMSYGANGTPSLVMTETGTSDLLKRITLDCSQATLTSADKAFYVVVPPGTLASGFSVEIVDGDDYSMFKNAKASDKNEIRRSKILCMPSFVYSRQYNSAVQNGDYGFYTSAGASSTPSYRYKYEEGSQIAYTTADKRTFRLQNWDKEYAVTFSNIPSNPQVGDSFYLYFKRMDKDVYDMKFTYYEVTVIRRIDSTLWAMDEDDNCFVLFIE